MDLQFDPFASIVGQIAVKQRLSSLLNELQGQFFIFSGPSGQGKKTLARAFAKGLLCAAAYGDRGPIAGPSRGIDQTTGSDLGSHANDLDHRSSGAELDRRSAANDLDHRSPEERAADWFDASTHPDYKEVLPEERGKLIPVDRVRREIVSDVEMLPQFGGRKVYLIDADALNEQGQNALLKTLEEPASYCVLLFTVSRPERLLGTIQSRGVNIPLATNSEAEVTAILQQKGIEITDHVAFAARYANGVPGVALDLATGDWFETCRASLIAILESAATASFTDLFAEAFPLFNENKDHIDVLLDILEIWLRDIMVAASPGTTTNDLVNRDRAKVLAQLADRYKGRTDRVSGVARAVREVRYAFSVNGNLEISITYLLLQLRKEFYHA